MSPKSLLDPVLDPGLRNPNFFEGRLLTAQALREDQKAHRRRQRLLGRAVGAGVVEGLTVRAEAAGSDGVRKTITISRGFAINGDGELLGLEQDVTADVVPPAAPSEPSSGLFARCKDEERPPGLPVADGIYVILMSPASGYRERAPRSGLGSEGRVIGCGDAYAVDGVRFRMEPLPFESISGADGVLRDELVTLMQDAADPIRRSRLRNLVAHLCFGTGQRRGFAVDSFARKDGASALLSYGALDDLRALERVTSCDVPLALFLWRANGIGFLDMWSVRRRPVPPTPSAHWPLLVGQRSPAEAEARLLQFQAQIGEMVAEVPNSVALKARECFVYLPPAGFLRAAGRNPDGIEALSFFDGVVRKDPQTPAFAPGSSPVFMDGSRIAALVHLSLGFPPIDLRTREFVWLYRVRDNAMALDGLLPDAVGAGVVVFASGSLPYVALPHFDFSRWDYSNYSSVLLGPGGF